ncbi:hypothetical protein SAMN05660976_04544 [Nonomuraea pusilla]|uniref:Uncharacterized protein n=1 Tax=Nonomuraea pusilla TaxID=46177 RepID=A0A1H7WR46_9ACTN|nr:hypothetical protein SAMN05660976_04544 [Nonomuraea pusilla]
MNRHNGIVEGDTVHILKTLIPEIGPFHADGGFKDVCRTDGAWH